MFNEIFYHNTLRKVVISFGTIFNDIWVIRRKANSDEERRIKVPIAYGPREKYLIRLKDDPSLNRSIDLLLPRMSFQFTSFEYAGQRKLNTMGKNFRSIPGDNTEVSRIFNGVTYNVGLELSVMTKFMDDGNQIIEQILPWFTPDYTVTINAIPELELKDDLPITLHTVQMTDSYDDEWKERRNLIWTLTFSTMPVFYGPIKTQPIITKAQVDTLVPTGPADLDNPEDRAKVPRYIRSIVVPDPLDADPESDFGYTETIEEFEDSKKYDPVTGTDIDIP